MTATTLGTPASPKWDDDWMARVDSVELNLGHRICGAHTPAWTPCKLTSTHPNGRCRFHGGAAGIGAPNGNRNAWVHGLYSRRLQQCGDHCPLWNHCPMAGNDVLDLHPTERPHCVYEQEEYDVVLSELRRKAETNDANSENEAPPDASSLRKQGSPDVSAPRSRAHNTQPSNPGPSPTCGSSAACSSEDSCLRRNDGEEGRNDDGGDVSLRASAAPREPGLIERNVALFQVMLTRAQAALRVHRLTDESSAQSKDYEARSTRVGALLTAQLQIARELRHWLKLLPAFDLRIQAKLAEARQPSQPQGLHERMQEILRETEGILEAALEDEDCDDDPEIDWQHSRKFAESGATATTEPPPAPA